VLGALLVVSLGRGVSTGGTRQQPAGRHQPRRATKKGEAEASPRKATDATA